MKRTALILGTAVTILLTTGCSAYRDRLAEAAMEGGDAKYDAKGNLYQLYEYYPDQQVYRSVYGGTWHYYNDNTDTWYRAPRLPEHVDMTDASHELIELPTSHPWHQHAIIAKQYPSIHELRAQATAVQNDHYGDFIDAEAYATAPIND